MASGEEWTFTVACVILDRKSTRLNSSHTEIYILSLHDALPISLDGRVPHVWPSTSRWLIVGNGLRGGMDFYGGVRDLRSEEHTSELQSHRDLHSFPTRRSSDLAGRTSTACVAEHEPLANCRKWPQGRNGLLRWRA